MKTRIIDTRVDFNGVRRRHLCPSCEQRFSTIEVSLSTYQFLVSSLKNIKKIKSEIKELNNYVENVRTDMLT
jgi:transcriptional regulator NrdR family protein